MAKAIALYSGGLDSTLAIIAVRRLGIAVLAVKFLTKFGCADSESNFTYLQSVSAKYDFEYTTIDISKKFIEIVRQPQFGYGKNLNPCIDCKVMMLKEAKYLLTTHGADFIVTGEVLGQRPMSQRKDVLMRIEKSAGVSGLVLRPLCAKLLRPIKAQQDGIVDTDNFYSISGRSRKVQMQLAEEFGLHTYQGPAGGCLLTEPNFAHRLKEYLHNTSEIDFDDIELLRIGRHFRTPNGSKIIVGRNETENQALQMHVKHSDIILNVPDVSSPLTLLRLKSLHAKDKEIQIAASITVRYSDAKKDAIVRVAVQNCGVINFIDVYAIDYAKAKEMMILKNA